jgi:hypothetical protein
LGYTCLNLECLPILDVVRKVDLEWLVTHTSLQSSTRERTLREASMAPAAESHKYARINFKDTLFSMFMHFTRLQGQPARFFGPDNPTAGGVNVIIFVSCLQLDIANHTVVLDLAVLHLTKRMVSRVVNFLSSSGIRHIRVDDDELRLWKEPLPAFVERCRRWEHRPRCKYASKSRVLENSETLPCYCCNRIFPPGYISAVPGWDLFSKFASSCDIAVVLSPFCRTHLRRQRGRGDKNQRLTDA